MRMIPPLGEPCLPIQLPIVLSLKYLGVKYYCEGKRFPYFHQEPSMTYAGAVIESPTRRHAAPTWRRPSRCQPLKLGSADRGAVTSFQDRSNHERRKMRR